MKKELDIIVIQKKFYLEAEKNIDSLEAVINKLDFNNPTIIVLHELSLSKYFCISKSKKNFHEAIDNKSLIMKRIKHICKTNKVFLLFSYFEKINNDYYNSSNLISPKGTILGNYRKKNLPNELCYHELFYFKPNKKQFKVIDIGFCKIGLMLCWDQWYSDSYAKLRKLGAEIILCPSSIGNTYVNNNKITLPDEKKMWFNVIQSNSLMNNIPVVIANRIGKEMNGKRLISFWGSSFITNADGAIIVKSLHNKEDFLKTTIDLSHRKKSIKKWGFFKK